MAQYHIRNGMHGDYTLSSSGPPSGVNTWAADLEFIKGPFKGNKITAIADVPLQLILKARLHDWKMYLYDSGSNTNLQKVEWDMT
jgi:hypothetical protein